MHPSSSSYRVDLMTKAYEPLKQQLLQQAEARTGAHLHLAWSGVCQSLRVEGKVLSQQAQQAEARAGAPWQQGAGMCACCSEVPSTPPRLAARSTSC